MCMLLFISFTAACSKEEIPRIPPGECAIVYQQINKVLGYEQPVLLDVDGNKESDITLNSVLLEYNDRPYLVLTVSGSSHLGNSTIISKLEATTGNANWSSPLHEGFTIFENATGERKWSMPQEKGYLAAIMDDGTNKEFSGLWIDKQKRYIGIAIHIQNTVHYGWICISHESGTKQFQVHDMAYNKKTGAVIKAGQKKEIFEGFVGSAGEKD